MEKEALISFCQKEALRTEEEAYEEYEKRLNNIESKAIKSPHCTPYVKEGRKTEVEWIDNADVRLVQGFDFYHHKHEDILEYAVKHRGDYEEIFLSMKELYVDEFPAPNINGKAFMVSANGQHRRLVFGAIGLPRIKANVQKCSGTFWRYAFGNYNINVIKILIWLQEQGILEREDIRISEDDTLLVRDKRNIIPWILPDPRKGTIYKLLLDMRERLCLLKTAFPEIENNYLEILNSQFKCIIYIQLIYLKGKITKSFKVKD